MAQSPLAFCPQDWVGRGLLIGDLPSDVQAHIETVIAIPPDIASMIPPPTLEIITLCRLALPTTGGHVPERFMPRDIFVSQPVIPTTHEALFAAALLPEAFLAAADALLSQAWLDGLSVRHPDSPVTFPLWVIKFWLAIHPACASREKWLAADAWVERVKQRSLGGDESLMSCIAKLSAMLPSTPWDLPMRQLHADAHISILQSILADGPLNQDYINTMVGILRLRLSRDSVTRMHVLDLNEVSHIGKLRDPDLAATYATAHKFRHIRTLGERLVSRDIFTIVFPYHLPHLNHWAAFRIDRTGEDCVCFASGDSLEVDPPVMILSTFCAWMAVLGLRVDTQDGTMPHGTQEDSISCGIAAINTLEHALFGTPRFRYLHRDVFRISKALEILYAYHRSDYASQLPLELWPRPAGPSTSSPSPSAVAPPLPSLTSVEVRHASARPSFPKPTVQSVLKFGVLSVEQKAERERQRLATLKERLEQAAIDKQTAEDERAAALELQIAEERMSTKLRVQAHRERKKAAEIVAGKRAADGTKPRKPRKSTTPAERVVPAEATVPNPAAAALPDSPFILPAPAPPTLPTLPAVSSDTPSTESLLTPVAFESCTEPAPLPRAEPAPSAPAVSITEPSTSLAELSRPFRAFKQLPKKKKCPGRPKTHAHTVAKRVNWQSPLLWPTIQLAALRAGPEMRPIEIVREAQKLDPAKFNLLAPQTVGDWIKRPKLGMPSWEDNVLARASKQWRAGGESTRIGILAANPELAEKLVKKFKQLRGAGVPITIHTAHALTQGMITHFDPSLFEMNIGNGVKFICSMTWVRRAVMHNLLGFSLRQPTRAAQKLPNDVLQLGEKYYMRVAYTADRYLVPPELIVNSDQTQSRYAYGSDATWAEKGSKQVSVVGQEEKRAFTLNVGISMSGELLPFQAIFTGMTNASIPSANARGRQEADDMGFLFEPSKTKTYWSTQKTMQSYVDKILMPYFERTQVALGLPEDQRFIWLIDAWSVHRSAEFRDWMKANHPRIIILYVPANCTSVYQPCDVGIQRVLKHALKRAAHADVVVETVAKLAANDGDADRVKLDVSLPILRDRTVQWMLKAFEACKNPEFVKKAWHCVQVGEDRLTEEFLTSRATRLRLRTLYESNPALWKELTGGQLTQPEGNEPDPTLPDADPAVDDDSDDTAIPTADVIATVMGRPCDEEWTTNEHGRIQPGSVAESDDPDRVLASFVPDESSASTSGDRPMDISPPPAMADGPAEAAQPTGRPKRARRPPGWYADPEDLPL